VENLFAIKIQELFSIENPSDAFFAKSKMPVLAMCLLWEMILWLIQTTIVIHVNMSDNFFFNMVELVWKK
jgi:hypothetical protein